MENIVNFLTSNRFKEVKQTEPLKRRFTKGPYILIYEDGGDLSIYYLKSGKKSVDTNDVIALIAYLKLSPSRRKTIKNKKYDLASYYFNLKEKYAENLSDIDKAFVGNYEECYREYLKS